MAEIVEKLKNLTIQRKSELWGIWVSISMVVLFMIPFILNVRLYADDFDRAGGGTLRWSTDGRIVANLLYRIAHLGSNRAVFDHPLGAIICIPIIILGGLFAYLLFNQKSFIWIGVLGILLFGQPYFLENLSFGFDSPQMVLSVAMCIAAAWLCVSAKDRYHFLISGSLVSISLLIYQPANNAFWIPIFMIAIYSWRNQADSVSRQIKFLGSTKTILVNSILIQTASLAVYKFIFSPFFDFTEYSRYIQQMPKLRDLPPTILWQIDFFWNKLLTNSFESALGIFLVIYIIVSIVLVSSGFGIWIGLAKVILFVSVLALSQGLMLTLVYKGFPPRTYIGVGAFLVSLAPLTWSVLENQWRFHQLKVWTRRVYIGILAAIVWGLISCSFAYGSAFKSQSKLNDYYRQTIANEILRDESTSGEKNGGLIIIGHSPLSPIAKNTFKVYPYMSHIIDRVGGHSRGIRQFRQYGLVLDRVSESELDGSKFQINSDRFLINRPDFTISRQNNIIVVRFK